MNVPLWVWIAVIAGIAAVFTVSLVFGRKAHIITAGEAAKWVAGYVALGIAFGIGVWLTAGGTYAGQFFARLAETHTPGQTHQAVALAQAMQSSLTDLRVYVLGHDPEVGPIHPVYVVGLATDGSIAGLRARVQWS